MSETSYSIYVSAVQRYNNGESRSHQLNMHIRVPILRHHRLNVFIPGITPVVPFHNGVQTKMSSVG